MKRSITMVILGLFTLAAVADAWGRGGGGGARGGGHSRGGAGGHRAGAHRGAGAKGHGRGRSGRTHRAGKAHSSQRKNPFAKASKDRAPRGYRPSANSKERTPRGYRPSARKKAFSRRLVTKHNGPPRQVAHRHPDKDYLTRFGKPFRFKVDGVTRTGRYLPGRCHRHWKSYCWNDYYRKWLYYDEDADTYFYYCCLCDCYRPIEYACEVCLCLPDNPCIAPGVDEVDVDGLVKFNGPAHELKDRVADEDYPAKYGKKFQYLVNDTPVDGWYYPGRCHKHWQSYCSNSCLKKWLFYDEFTEAYYYYCGPCDCYRPLGYVCYLCLCSPDDPAVTPCGDAEEDNGADAPEEEVKRGCCGRKP